MIAFLGALKDEVEGLRRALVISHRGRRGVAPVWSGKLADGEAMVMRAGPGRQRAEDAARFLIDNYPLSAIVSLGFGGGLTPTVKAGDLVLCQRVYVLNGIEEPLASDDWLMDAAVAALRQANINFHRGNALTVPGIIGQPREKVELGRSFVAAVAEMESYYIARVAKAAHVPFLAVRAISDEVDDFMPDVQRFVDSAGRVQARKAVRYLMGHPEHTAALIRLGANTRRAAESLTAFGLALMTCTAWPSTGSGRGTSLKQGL